MPVVNRQGSDSGTLRDRDVVLVATDNAETRPLITEALSDEYRVVPCSDAAEALEKAIADPPDLVVMDLMAPEFDWLVAEMRAREPLTQVPVLVLSAKADEALRGQLLEKPVQDYVIKPFSAQELRARVRNLVMIKRSRDLLQKELDSQNEDLAELAQQVVISRQELQRSLEALRASEERWRAIFENSAVGIVVTNPEGSFTATNRAYQQMVGYSDDELRGLSYPDITHEEDRPANHALAKTQWEGKLRQFMLEKRYRRKDGRLIWVRSTVSLALGGETVPPFGMAIIEDITERKRAEEAMRRSQMMFEKLFDASPDAIVASDRQGRIARVSEQAEKIFGYRRAELLGQPVEVLVPEIFRRVHSAHREDYYAQPRVRPMGAGLELHGRRKDGAEFPVDILLNLIDTEEGPLVLSVVRDVTERKQAEEQLKRSEAYLVESERLSHVGSWAVTITPPRKLLFWSEENYRICGFDPANGTPSLRAVVGRIHPEDHAKGDEAVRAAIRERRDFVFDCRIILPDGTTKFCHSIGHPVLSPTGDVVEFTGTVMDVTESKRAEDALQRSFDQLHALTAQLQSVREEERTGVAREIHDELGQALTAIKLDVTALVRELPADQGPAVQRGQSILKLLDEAIQSVQRISTDLRPGILDDLGLAAALEWAAEDFEGRTETKCRIRMPEEDITIDPDRATALFRIFQETLTNVARHAEATEVNVRLGKENDDLVLEVHDNGLGIREEQLSSGKSLGILGMRERALLLGGELTISGTPGKGTTVKVRIPSTHRESAETGK